MSGVELAHEARAHRPDLRVLFTSGYTRDNVVRDGRLDPGVELVEKPFSKTTLARKVHTALRESLRPDDK